MSTKGIYTAVSGAIAQSSKLDTIANNIANTNTTAFKKSKQVFNEYLTANEKTPDVIQVPKVPASIESFYDMQGGDKAYVNAAGTYVDHTQGVLKATGNNFDMAIEGSGYFEVLGPEGVRLTRDGSFKRDVDGRLVTKQGYPVLFAGATGGNPQARVISIDSNNLTISFTGQIFANGEEVGQISMVDVNNKEALKPIGQNSFSLKPNYNEALVPAVKARVHQGFLEASNVNVVAEMTDMINATRTFETTQQAIKAFDSMNEKLVNVVPRIK